jgi:AcrR family transcriptional regulator
MKKNHRKAPGRPGRLSAEQSAELPGRLLDAAMTLFNRQGFSETTMEEVAREAGASTKTLYSRYANKLELARAVVNRLVDQTLAGHAVIAPDPRQVDPRIFLNALGRRVHASIVSEGAGMIQMAFAEARRFPEIAKLYDDVLVRARAFNSHMLRGWGEQGLLPAMHDPDYAALVWVSILTDMARIRVALGNPMPAEETDRYVSYVVDLFLRGLGYRIA